VRVVPMLVTMRNRFAEVVVMSLLPGILALVAAIGHRPLRWRLAFVANSMGLLLFGGLIQFNFRRESDWLALIVLPLWIVQLLIVAVRDRRSGEALPWTHWLGIAAAIWVSAGATVLIVLHFLTR